MLGIGIEEIQIFKSSIAFRLIYEKYNGDLTASDGALGGGKSTEVNFEKSILSLSIVPITLNIWQDKFDLSLGFEFSKLIRESFDGTRSSWTIGQPSVTKNIKEDYESYNSNLSFGIRNRLAYNIRLSDTFTIKPQYSVYFGITGEFKEFPQSTRSIRHSLGLGIEHRFR